MGKRDHIRGQIGYPDNIPDSYGESVYAGLLGALERYFHGGEWKRLFLRGGCYWFADILHREIEYSKIMINRADEHCAICFGGGMYDITGRIGMKNFHVASEREIQFMKKNYIPKFDADKLEQYLESAKPKNHALCCGHGQNPALFGRGS